mgnify:CR=1 FL=1
MQPDDSSARTRWAPDVSVVIPTYRRGDVLLHTLDLLFRLDPPPGEILVVDQTEQHSPAVAQALLRLESAGRIRVIRFSPPSIPRAMNVGLREAKGAVVLYVDDDVEPASNLVAAHAARYAGGFAAVCGQVLQPGEGPDPAANPGPRGAGFRADLDFRFCGTRETVLASVISCNLSVDRERALSIGGFDEQFIGSAYRYETDFARRLVAAGHRILFAPEASLRHLRLATGGTRSLGDHLRHPSPLHSVGDYYFAFRHACGTERWTYLARRLLRETCNRFYLKRPWQIPAKVLSELRAFGLAIRLHRQGPHWGGAVGTAGPYRLFAVETHPIQYKAPLFRKLAADPRIDLTVFYALIPDAAQQGAGFGVPFAWDVPLLEGYRHEVLENRATRPSVTVFSGCDTPGLFGRLRRDKPDAVLVNGWGTKTCLQALWACRRLGIPCLVRGEANRLRSRAAWKHALHRMLLRQYGAFLAIGSANRDFYRFHHCPEARIFWAPYAVDNGFFAAQAAARAGRRAELRAAFGIPPAAVVFLFAGKLEEKKRPLDLLDAVSRLPADLRAKAHVLVAGDGPLRAACERMALERDLRVSFAGFLNQSRLPDAYAAADVLVLPSDAGETWGLVVNEAMASGRPAVVSRAAGCCADLILEDQTGHSFALHDVPGLADILAGYLRAPGLAARQGLAAAEQIRPFGLETAAAGIAAAVAACAGRRRPC